MTFVKYLLSVLLFSVALYIHDVAACSDDSDAIPVTNVVNYVGKGTEAVISANGLRAYVTGASGNTDSCPHPSPPPSSAAECGQGKPTHAIVVFYDVYGFDVENTRHFCDLLAAHTGFLVIMPDFYDGRPWPRKDYKSMSDWLAAVAPWDKVHADLQSTKIYLANQYQITSKLGVLGFCWGGGQALKACALPDFAAGGSIHGAWLTSEDAAAATSPMFFITPGGDPSTAPIKAVFDKNKEIGDKCEYQTYDDVKHGFAANGGDWSNSTVRYRVEQSLQLACSFFSGLLKKL